MLKEFAKDLKRLRELKGITIAEISAQTRINPKFLINIEKGIFDFQPETYIRSFIKEYARAIDENENHVLNDYDKAKAGFYARRKFVTKEGKEIIIPEEKPPISVKEPLEEKEEEPVYSKGIKEDKPDYFKAQSQLYENDVSNRTFARKIIFGILIAAVLAGIYFLVDYLNGSGDKKTDVKPKSFNEMTSEYENKISNKKDSVKKQSTQTGVSDSLRLLVKAIKDIKVKVYLDENKVIEEDISAKDSLFLKAKEQFRFSATANSSVELYLNGVYLRKPATLTGSSIKNLVINKDGIVTQ